MTQTLRVPLLPHPMRLDAYLTETLHLTRSRIKTLLDGEHIRVNGAIPEKAGARLRGREEIRVYIPPPPKTHVLGEAIPLDIIHEDEELLVLNKPAGLVVHPAAGNWSGTLANALVYHMKNLSGIDPTRPGIVHRLDKETSGILLVAKTDRAHLELSRQLKDRKIEKVYQALVHGRVIQDEGIIDKPIGRHPKNRKKMGVVASGRSAQTRYRVLKRTKGFTLLEVYPETGRTHQIRVHLASLGYPVVGDALYGKRDEALGMQRHLLHASKITFRHPATGRIVSFEAPLPSDFTKALRQFGDTSGSVPSG